MVETFGGHFHVPLVHVQAQERFLGRLEGVTEPEEKRKIVGEEFIRVFEEEARRLGDVRFLVQGTLYSDVIESGGTDEASRPRSSRTTTSAACPRTCAWSSSSRCGCSSRTRCGASARSSACPSGWSGASRSRARASRSGSSARSRSERLEILRAADAILQDEVRRAGLYRELWQCFAVLPAIRSVGVQGDERTYAYPIVIRAVTSEDAMTADWARLPYDLLETISSRIINEIPGVNRVALDISSKPPSTIEWE